jgi:hypothetical protein
VQRWACGEPLHGRAGRRHDYGRGDEGGVGARCSAPRVVCETGLRASLTVLWASSLYHLEATNSCSPLRAIAEPTRLRLVSLPLLLGSGASATS